MTGICRREEGKRKEKGLTRASAAVRDVATCHVLFIRVGGNIFAIVLAMEWRLFHSLFYRSFAPLKGFSVRSANLFVESSERTEEDQEYLKMKINST